MSTIPEQRRSLMRLPGLLFLLWCSTIAGVSSSAQAGSTASAQAQVTFYSHPVTALGGMPGHPPEGFRGRLFVEDHQLAFMEAARFVTFHLDPGLHRFSATWWTAKHAESGAHVLISLVAGEHYFLETGISNSGLLFGNVNLFIKEVTCEGALQDNLKNKPLDVSHLKPDGRPLVVAVTAFPPCN